MTRVEAVIPLHDENPTRGLAWVTVVLIAINIAVFFLIQPRADTSEGLEFSYQYAAIPCEISRGDPLTTDQIVETISGRDTTACDDAQATGPVAFPDKQPLLAVITSMFLHGDIFHLGFNMLFLWIFGNNVEDHLGKIKYIVFYLVSGIAATATHLAFGFDSTIPIIGASGAIAGVMGAYLVWFPNARVRTLVFAIFVFFVEISAKWLLVAWLVSQFFLADDSGIARWAHIGGFVFGVLFALAVRESLRARRALWRTAYVGNDAGWWDNRHGGRVEDPTPPYGNDLPPYDGPIR